MHVCIVGIIQSVVCAIIGIAAKYNYIYELNKNKGNRNLFDWLATRNNRQGNSITVEPDYTSAYVEQIIPLIF